MSRVLTYLLLFIAPACAIAQKSGTLNKNVVDNNQILIKQISLADTTDLSNLIVETATGWAIAGFIEQANILLENAWSYKLASSDDYYHSIKSFAILWQLSGKQPRNIPFDFGTAEQIEQYNWDELFFPGQWSNLFLEKFQSKPWTDLSDQELRAKAIIMAYDESSNNHRANPAEQLESLKALAKYIQTDTAAGNYGSLQALACAAILAANNNEYATAISFIEQWGKCRKKFYNNQNVLMSLSKERATAQILLTGILAPIFQLTKEHCEIQLSVFIPALKQRMGNGQQKVYEKLSMHELLERISNTAIKVNNYPFNKTVQQSQWLGYPPATVLAIAAAEKKLGLNFPDDYKEFLLATNGFHSYSNIGINFLPVEKIGRLKDLDPELVEIWNEPAIFGDSATTTAFANSLLIGGYQEEQQLLLIPPYKNSPTWTYWYFATWMAGKKTHPGLRFYLEKELLELEKRSEIIIHD